MTYDTAKTITGPPGPCIDCHTKDSYTDYVVVLDRMTGPFCRSCLPTNKINEVITEAALHMIDQFDSYRNKRDRHNYYGFDTSQLVRIMEIGVNGFVEEFNKQRDITRFPNPISIDFDRLKLISYDFPVIVELINEDDRDDDKERISE
ncbi:MAG: hypothetical protein GF411_03130 [Candidatus Lokiarchaeota archaeon]|nr:hypothetical protein [Candidatus Lokiarchaeota archaeon]